MNQIFKSEGFADLQALLIILYFIYAVFSQVVSVDNTCFWRVLSGAVKYKPGWGTRFIEGTVLEDSGEVLKSKCFIVVLEYYSQFIQFENEFPLYAPKARLIFLEENGQYRISFDLEGSAIELAFVASGYDMKRFSFQRQIGIGALLYDARLSRSEIWKNQFLMQTSPFLENFIPA